MGIRRITVTLLASLALVLFALNAHAAGEILSYEQLMALEEPCTVYVEGKTGDPYPVHMKYTLMERTKWQWMLKDNKGAYCASGHYVTMSEYKAMDISMRSLILNHEDCRLEIQVSGPGQWFVTQIRVVDHPITLKGFFLPIIILIIAGCLYVPIFERFINAPVSETQTQQRPGILLLTTFFLTGLFKNDSKHQK